MKRLLPLLICLSLSLSLAACGGRQTDERTRSSPENSSSQAPQPSQSSQTSPPATDLENASADASSEMQEAAAASEGQKILIAYFTWAENTRIEDTASVDVDATASASVLLPGNAAILAGWIQERTGGDLFSIVATEPYSSDYDECLDRAAAEKAESARPKLVNHLENMDDYDVVFLGFPNWWYTVPMAIHSFLEEYDFSGKTVVPFCTHGTGGLASTIRDIAADLPDSAAVLEPIGVYRQDTASARPAVEEWLDGLGLEIQTEGFLDTDG